MKIAAIKIEQKKLGLSDLKYRQILNDVAGVDSARFLAPGDVIKVYRRMHNMATANSRAARYFWVLWKELQPYLDSAELKWKIRKMIASGELVTLPRTIPRATLPKDSGSGFLQE